MSRRARRIATGLALAALAVLVFIAKRKRLLGSGVALAAVSVYIGSATIPTVGCEFPDCFPSESNTGVPSGTTLTAYTGSSTISAEDTVIDSKEIDDCLNITADNVTIRNSVITCPSSIAINHVDDATRGTILIEDSEIDCGDTNGTGFAEADFTLIRVEIRGCGDGMSINQNVLVEDSLIWKMTNVGADPHSDNIQFGCGHYVDGTTTGVCDAGYHGGALNITVRHSTLYAAEADGTLTDKTITRNGGTNVDTNILYEENLLSGGGTTLHCFDGDSPTELVRDNHFSTLYEPEFGWSDGCSEEDAGGNVVHETDEPLDLN
jgi:hypothetical protein